VGRLAPFAARSRGSPSLRGCREVLGWVVGVTVAWLLFYSFAVRLIRGLLNSPCPTPAVCVPVCTLDAHCLGTVERATYAGPGPWSGSAADSVLAGVAVELDIWSLPWRPFVYCLICVFGGFIPARGGRWGVFSRLDKMHPVLFSPSGVDCWRSALRVRACSFSSLSFCLRGALCGRSGSYRRKLFASPSERAGGVQIFAKCR